MGRRRRHGEKRHLCRQSGKRLYPSRLEALDALGRIDHARRPRAEVSAYLCPHCGGYHLTSEGNKNA